MATKIALSDLNVESSGIGNWAASNLVSPHISLRHLHEIRVYVGKGGILWGTYLGRRIHYDGMNIGFSNNEDMLNHFKSIIEDDNNDAGTYVACSSDSCLHIFRDPIFMEWEEQEEE